MGIGPVLVRNCRREAIGQERFAWNIEGYGPDGKTNIYSCIEQTSTSRSRKRFCGSVQTNLPRPANHRPFFRYPSYPHPLHPPSTRVPPCQLRETPGPQPHQPGARDPNWPAGGQQSRQTTQNLHSKPGTRCGTILDTYLLSKIE